MVKKCAVKGAGLQRVQLPPGNWFAPPGSNRNDGGGNKTVVTKKTRSEFIRPWSRTWNGVVGEGCHKGLWKFQNETTRSGHCFTSRLLERRLFTTKLSERGYSHDHVPGERIVPGSTVAGRIVLWTRVVRDDCSQDRRGRAALQRRVVPAKSRALAPRSTWTDVY